MIDKKLIEFIKEHHILTLASSYENIPYCASCFYAFYEDKMRFIIASENKTKHMQNLNKNPNFAGSIALETKEVGKIRGLQFGGTIKEASLREKAFYIKTFPYALALNPTLWSLDVDYMKFTDNRLGFGKKLELKKNRGLLAPID